MVLPAHGRASEWRAHDLKPMLTYDPTSMVAHAVTRPLDECTREDRPRIKKFVSWTR
jgi:hypothetical protein